MTAPSVHLTVTRALEALTAIADDVATEHGISHARITAQRGSLEWFDQVIDAIAAEIDAAPFEAARRRVIAALEEEIADRLDQAVSHMDACTAVTREGVIRALEARFAEDEAAGTPVDGQGHGR